MSDYLIATWDYAAEGELELSFRQGDKIKLLEKHNDDWWEGQLDDAIGFFPANRVRFESLENQDHDNTTDSLPQRIPLEHHDSIKSDTDIIAAKEVKDHALVTVASAPAIMNELPLPYGWQEAHAPDGSVYYFNEATRQTTWDRPTENEAVTDHQPSPPAPPPLPPRNNVDLEETLIEGLAPEDLSKLEFDRLQKEWIRHQGYVEMKMISEKDAGGKLSSWKAYYAVLSNGFLLLYKESHARNKKTSKSQIPVGSFDLDSCKIDPASKQDTKRKHVFIISTPRKVKLFVQAVNNTEFSSWLDAIMRELIARKEGQNQDSDILKLLKSLSIDESQMKVNRKMIQEDESKKKYWFSSKQPGKAEDNSEGITSPKAENRQMIVNENSVFGGDLRMDENGDIPHIVSLCIEQVEERGLKSVGIYRLSGPASSIQKYKAMFNQGETVCLQEEQDINAVTGLLKLYFRELRNPLMTYEYYDWFTEAARITDYEERMYQIKSIIHSLPKPNFIVLEYLMRHLSRVASYSEINKMEPSNLALIFSVGLLRAPQEDLSSIMMSDLHSKVVEAIIQQVDWFFEKEDNTQE